MAPPDIAALDTHSSYCGLPNSIVKSQTWSPSTPLAFETGPLQMQRVTKVAYEQPGAVVLIELGRSHLRGAATYQRLVRRVLVSAAVTS